GEAEPSVPAGADDVEVAQALLRPPPPGAPPPAGAPPAGGGPPPPACCSRGPPRTPSDGNVAMYARMSESWLSERIEGEKQGMPWRPLRTTFSTLSLTGLMLRLPLG